MKDFPCATGREDLGRGIYIISAGDYGPCKVGITNDLTLRISALQVGSWQKLKPVLFSFVVGAETRGLNVWSVFSNAATEFEKLAHRQMKDLDLHLMGEWFDVEPEDCKKVLAKVAEMNGMRLVGPEALLGLKHYKKLPARQVRYIEAMIAAEESAQKAFSGARINMLDE